jgi:hypothetical protein
MKVAKNNNLTMQFATMNFGTAGKKSDFCFAFNNFLG